MNRRRRRPFTLHLRPTSKSKIVYRRASKPSLKIILPCILLALVIAGALGFAAVNFVKNARLRHSAQKQVASPTATASPVMIGTENPVTMTSSPSPLPSVPATPAPTPLHSLVPASTPLVANDALRLKTPAESTRKSAEQRRREAERKRTHLEALHKNHQISDQAYKHGQEEYQAEMAKYRNAVSGEGSTNRPQ